MRFLLLLMLLFPLAVQAQAVNSEKHRFTVTRLATLDYPWGLAFLPDGRMLVTGRRGQMNIVNAGGQVAPPLTGVPGVAFGGQGGLLDVALHPSFAENRLVYLTYAAAGDGGASTRLARGRLGDAGLTDLKEIYEAVPRTSGGRHFGSRIAFGPDGFLYVAFGERGQMESAQEPGMIRGKVVRLRDDGSVPPDNPFAGRAGARPEIFTTGHRNPQGMTFNPRTGDLWLVEHGPRGGDELNLVRGGRNYGWPLVTYGIDYSGAKIGDGTSKPELEEPARYWVPSISPSGLAIYFGDAFPNWRGSLFLGGLSGQVLTRLELDGTRVVHEERLLAGSIGRIRDVRAGPDGKLYLLGDGASGGLYRLDPA
jgi:glucose/arabinose dehydrogenase